MFTTEYTPSPLASYIYTYRVLFADHEHQEDLVERFFMQSGVEETLRAQQLTMEHFNQLCLTYEALCNISNSNHNADNNNHESKVFKNQISEFLCV